MSTIPSRCGRPCPCCRDSVCFAAAEATLRLAGMAYEEGRLEEAVGLLDKAARSDSAQVRARAADAPRQLRAAE